MRVQLDVTIITSLDVVNYWRALGQHWSFVAGKEKGKICNLLYFVGSFIHNSKRRPTTPHGMPPTVAIIVSNSQRIVAFSMCNCGSSVYLLCM